MKSLYLISFMLLVSLISSAQVKYIGHRGASYYAPENSLGSLQLAWQLGADGAECDIYLTTDNQIVVWHDGNTAPNDSRWNKIGSSQVILFRIKKTGS